MSYDGSVYRRLLRSVRQAGDCVVWAKATNAHGYGVMRVAGGNQLAHRVAWSVLRGAIPPGMVVCHSCDNPPCVNPTHLFVGSMADNNADKRAKGREWHPAKLTPEDRAEIAHRYVGGRGIRHSNGSELAKEFGVSRNYIGKIARTEKVSNV